jgi:hypothetical protein
VVGYHGMVKVKFMDCFRRFGVPANSAERASEINIRPRLRIITVLPTNHKPQLTLQTTPRLTRALRNAQTYVVLDTLSSSPGGTG